jgi:chorismate dehydratase
VEDIRRLSLDEGSRTSAALVRILLAERFDVRPDCEPLPMGASIDATDANAVLLIGDRAIHPPAEDFVVTWDLGEEWTRWTGLPFVFAVWAARHGVDLRPIEPAFAAARDRGLQRLREIARRESIPLGIDERTAYHYLSRSLHFRLGPEERAGLDRFRELAAQHGFADAFPEYPVLSTEY